MVYPSSKAALGGGAARGVKPEWAMPGIRLNSVARGHRDPMVDQMRADPLLGPAIDAYPNAVGGRLGRPEEVVGGDRVPALRAAANIVGAVLFVDGGTDAMLHPISPPGWEVGPIEP